MPTRFYKDDDQVNNKVWYWAEPGAAIFREYNVQGSRFLMDDNDPSEDWKYPGELPGPFTFNSGLNPYSSPGEDGCQIGETEWFAEGAPPGVVLSDVTIPPCCRPLAPITAVRAVDITGSPNVNTTTTLWANGDVSLWLAVYDGPVTTPPTLPPGWIILLNEAGPTGTGWLVAMWQRMFTPFAPFVVNGGTLTSCDSTMISWSGSSVGVVQSDSDSNPSTFSFASPSINNSGLGRFLVSAIWYWPGATTPTPPGGMLSIAGFGFGANRGSAEGEYDVPAGPTGPRTWTFGPLAAAVTAMTVLVR